MCSVGWARRPRRSKGPDRDSQRNQRGVGTASFPVPGGLGIARESTHHRPRNRPRRLAILRVGSRCRSGYEWSQHARIGLDAGLSEEEITRIHEGSAAEGWTEGERAILDATDELIADAFVTDPTWKRLSSHYDTHQLMDLIFTVGQYNLVSMALNTLGVQLEDDASRLSPP